MRSVVVAEWNEAVLAEKAEQGGSNNIAELIAVEMALRWAKQQGCEELHIKTDSQNNLRWVFRTIGEGMNDRDRVLALRRSIERLRADVALELTWIPREQNLAGLYLENLLIASKIRESRLGEVGHSHHSPAIEKTDVNSSFQELFY